MRTSAFCLFAASLAAAAATLPATLRAEVKTGPLPVKAEVAYPNLMFDRPLILTHAGDGTNRVFVIEQRGRIRVFENKPNVKKAGVFLDIRKQTAYKDKENETGLLGLAFHPRYKENGEFYVYYMRGGSPYVSTLSRFRVSKDDPDRADPESEEVLLRRKQPFWNHNGGNLAFGPDGYLYLGLGDGGKANDPLKAGQDLSTILGKILRINVDRRDKPLAYAIPKDNPFADKPNARGEIWAYGLRNVWGMTFDRKTGDLWAADVGQNLWEEINIIVRGGNYGWNHREASHPFGPDGAPAGPKYIDPIWEYHHKIGKSITGGYVYRGETCGPLVGKYVYADYVSGLIWALDYDYETKQVRGNYTLEGPKLPIMSFGEDAAGEVYFSCLNGKIYRFVTKAGAKSAE